MLTFKITPNGNLEVSADNAARESLAELDNCIAREQLIAEEHYEPYYDYKTADQIEGNLSEAPIFASELDYSCDQGTIRFYDDCPAYYYDNYMLSDFTERLMNGESVIFTKI